MTATHDTDDAFVTDADFIAYVDGTLPPDKQATVEAMLAQNSAARDAVFQWRHHDALIREAAREADELPADLRIAALERELATKLKARQWRARLMVPGPVRQIAASVLIFAAGWGANGYFGSDRSIFQSQHPQIYDTALAGHHAYAHAHAVSAVFGADEMERALDWMSEQMQYKINSPKLERLGYEVESARMVIEDSTPVAVFYLRNAAGEQATVLMSPQSVGQPDHRLRVVKGTSENAAYWTDRNMNYAIVADVDAATITTLAAAVLD